MSTRQTTSRRQFLCGCACCAAGCMAGSPLVGASAAPAAAPAAEKPSAAVPPGQKPKVRLVFCETPNQEPIWPNIGYDFDSRRKQVLDALARGCPDVQFLPVKLMNDPKQADEVLKGDAEVQGYLVCLQGLGWRNDAFKLSTTGKPTLLVDNLFGGSGLFLTRQAQIMGAGKPVDWVSSSKDEDLVASARSFGLLKAGKGAPEVVAAFRAARRARTPKFTEGACASDPLPAVHFDEALKELRRMKLLVVGGGWGGDPFRKATEQLLGLKLVPIAFEEMSAACAQVDAKSAAAFAERWSKGAQRVVEPSPAELEKSGAMYAGMQQLIQKHGARGISINCLGGFYGGHLKAYPCLGFSQLNNDGMVGGCEADQMSALTMATIGALVGRPGFISDPVIDTSKNQVIYAHCVGMTRPFGPRGASNPYLLRSHSEDRKGAVVQSLLPAGYLTTTLEINPVSKQVLMHQARSVGNNPSDMACRTKLEGEVKGDIEKLTENWRMGWHRVTFYGDLKPVVQELCARLKLELIEEA